MPRSVLILCVCSMLLLAALGGCGGDDPPAKDSSAPSAKRLSIVSTSPVIHEIVQRIAGDRADAACLVRADDAPGFFDLHAGDVQSIAAADIVLVIGAGHEGAALETVATHAKGNLVRLAEHRDAAALRGAQSPGEEAGECWANPLVLRQFTQQIAGALAAGDPEDAAAFHRAANAYAAELTALSHWIDEAAKASKPAPMVTNSVLAAEVGRACRASAIRIELDPAMPATAGDGERVLAAIQTVNAKLIAIDPQGSEVWRELLAEAEKATGARLVKPAIRRPAFGEPYIPWMKATVLSLVGGSAK